MPDFICYTCITNKNAEAYYAAEKTGRTKTFYAVKAIEQQLDDMEDYYLAEQAYNEWVAEGKKTYSLDEVFG